MTYYVDLYSVYAPRPIRIGPELRARLLARAKRDFGDDIAYMECGNEWWNNVRYTGSRNKWFNRKRATRRHRGESAARQRKLYHAAILRLA